MAYTDGEGSGNIPDFCWDAAALSVKGDRRSGKRGEGEGRDVPPCPSPRAGANSGHTFAHARPAVLKARGRRPPQAVASGQSPGPSRSTIGSSYRIDRPAGRAAGRSGRFHSLRWRRNFSMTGASPIRLRILRGPWHRGQTMGSASNTRIRARSDIRPHAPGGRCTPARATAACRTHANNRLRSAATGLQNHSP